MDYSQILKQAFKQFILKVEGKEVLIPYRINIPPVEHPVRQGKSDPEVILKQLYEDAKKQSFDLKNSSVEQIQDFMRQNNLGLDCSGFVYRMLDFLVQKVKSKPLIEFGFDHVGKTNVATLTDNQHAVTVDSLAEAVPGDLIRTDSGAEDGLNHALIVLENKDGIITYAHSSGKTKVNGVHIDQIKEGVFPEDLEVFKYNIKKGDGVRRLKTLL